MRLDAWNFVRKASKSPSTGPMEQLVANRYVVLAEPNHRAVLNCYRMRPWETLFAVRATSYANVSKSLSTAFMERLGRIVLLIVPAEANISVIPKGFEIAIQWAHG